MIGDLAHRVRDGGENGSMVSSSFGAPATCYSTSSFRGNIDFILILSTLTHMLFNSAAANLVF